MSTLRCMIVDDEPLAREIITSYIERMECLDLVASCESAVQAFDLLHHTEIDVLFLDIQMPQLTGIELLKTLRHPPHVILTTAYRDYAIESYELDVKDYLLKPISFERFLKAIHKVIKPMETTVPAPTHSETKYIQVKADRKTVNISQDDILYIEGLKDYVRIKLTGGKEVITLVNLSTLENELSDEFFRVHRSFIISSNKVESFSAAAVNIGGKEIPIGRSYKSEVSKALGIQHD